MFKVGICQIPNSADISGNSDAIEFAMLKFKNEGVDLVVTPECALSGYTPALLNIGFAEIESATSRLSRACERLSIDLLLGVPVGVSGTKPKNSVLHIDSRGIKRDSVSKQIFTPTDEMFFVRDSKPRLNFRVKDKQVGVVICAEAVEAIDEFDQHFVDASFIVWPGMWAWPSSEQRSAQQSSNDLKLKQNQARWARPVLQANFSFTEGFPNPPGFESGQSHVFTSTGEVSFQAAKSQNDLFVAVFNDSERVDCRSIF